MKKNLLCIFFALSLGVFSCQKKSEGVSTLDSSQNQPVAEKSDAILPIPEWDVPTKSYQIVAEKGGQIRLDNGTEIIVPSDAFVDTEGDKIEGNVDLQYREIHSIMDVIGSGIPMTYTEKGEKKNFVTAGMFEINGTAQGEKVAIAPGKSIQVNMASYNPSLEAKFYVLEKKTLKWKYVSESSIVAKAPPKKTKNPAKAIEAEQPILPERADDEAFKFDIQVNLKKFPELSSYKEIIWQYVPSETEGFDDPEKTENFYTEPWTSIQLEHYGQSKETYKLILASKTRTFTSLVKPVLGERSFAKAKKEYERTMKAYDKLMQAETAINAQQAAIQRQISLTSFGTYNHDLFYTAKEKVIANAVIQTQANEPIASNFPSYLIVKSKNAVIKYSAEGYDNYSNFTFDKADKNALIVMLPGKKIAVFNADAFIKAQNAKNLCVFNTSTSSVEIADLKDMAKIIEKM